MSGGQPVDFGDGPVGASEREQALSGPKGKESKIDSVLLRGLYLHNSKQQEVVVDYFRNLVSSPFLNVDPNNQARAIKSTIPNTTEWAFPFELHLDLKKPIKFP
jgi:hypothetical protein